MEQRKDKSTQKVNKKRKLQQKDNNIIEEDKQEQLQIQKKIKLSSEKKQEKIVKDKLQNTGITKALDKKQLKSNIKNQQKIKQSINEQEEKNEQSKPDSKQINQQQQPRIKKNKTNRLVSKPDNKDLQTIIYIGRIPYGLMEDQLKQYFQQYGEVLNVKLQRSKKTARSQGYGFVQFKYPEIAAIAAKSMNNYMILGKQMVCHILKEGQRNPFLNIENLKKFRFINWKRIYIKEKNKPKDNAQLKKEVSNLVKNEEKRTKKLKELGIDYEFPGYKSIISEQIE